MNDALDILVKAKEELRSLFGGPMEFEHSMFLLKSMETLERLEKKAGVLKDA